MLLFPGMKPLLDKYISNACYISINPLIPGDEALHIPIYSTNRVTEVFNPSIAGHKAPPI
jgi:hypothetical protein